MFVDVSRTLQEQAVRHFHDVCFMEDGDVFIFDGLSQMSSTHAVLSMEGCGERTNLTFRSGI